eukprot:1581215-Ditylum_brightwellii.AAC.1
MQKEGKYIPSHAKISEIEEIYKSCIIHKQILSHKTLPTLVPFPVKFSDALENGSLGETIYNIDLSHGASFINDSQTISNKYLP